MSIGSILSIARSAIQAHQTAAAVVSNNIANAETEGYSRQRADLLPGGTIRFTYGTIGTGVTVDGVSRIRNLALDGNVRLQSGNAQGATVRSELLGEVESVFAEPSEQAMAAGLDAFFSAWSDLANNPTDATAKGAVRQRGAQVASLFNDYANRLNEIQNGTRDQLALNIDEANGLTQQMADLNRQITAAEADGHESPALRDERDLVSDKLATLLGARTVPQANGSYAVVVGGTTIVDASSTRPLALQAGSPASIVVAQTGSQVRFVGGTAGAMLNVMDTDIPAVRTKLDTMVKGFVNGVNHLQMSGWSAAGEALGRSNWNPLSGPTGSRIEFFDSTKTAAGSIALSADVLNDAGVIAAGSTQNGAGDNSVALSIGALRDDNGMAALEAAMGPAFGTSVGIASGTTFSEYYRDTVSTLGLDVSAAEADSEAFKTLASQAETRRSSVMGVSIDEELTLLMRHQQAFAAASRLVNTADEMAQEILNMV